MPTQQAAQPQNNTIRLYTWDRDRITEGSPVVVSYYPSRGDKSKPSERTGEIIYSQQIGEHNLRFWFFDVENNTRIEVFLDETLEDSVIRSKGDHGWTKIGSPIRVIASQSADSVDDLKQQHLIQARNEQYQTVISVAFIQWNDNIINVSE